MNYEEIAGLAKYLPDEVETANLVGKTIPPTKCKITPPKGYKKGENYGNI